MYEHAKKSERCENYRAEECRFSSRQHPLFFLSSKSLFFHSVGYVFLTKVSNYIENFFILAKAPLRASDPSGFRLVAGTTGSTLLYNIPSTSHIRIFPYVSYFLPYVSYFLPYVSYFLPYVSLSYLMSRLKAFEDDSIIT